MTALADLAARLAGDRSLLGKLDIQESCRELGLTGDAAGQPGDDAAVLPEGDGFALFAMEGFINAFVQADPWFAGWCGVMVNISDILAMGGRPTAITNAIWAPDAAAAAPILAGMRAASAAYGVPIVGGHTNLRTPACQLAVSITGRARRIISSFAARPGHVLVAAIDHRGAYREPFDNWQAALGVPAERLRGDMEILPALAEAGLAPAGKDISQGGIIGTALMLAECSGVGIEIAPATIPLPPGVSLERWLKTFPSFGFLLAVPPENAAQVCARFAARQITAAVIGRVSPGTALTLRDGDHTATVWDHGATAYLGLSQKARADA